MIKFISCMLCAVLFGTFSHGVVCGFDDDIVCVEIDGDEYGFYGDGFTIDDDVIILMNEGRIEGVW